MPMAVSLAAHPDRVKKIYRTAVKEITAAAGPSGASIIDELDSAYDVLDKKDEDLSDGGIIIIIVCLYAWPISHNQSTLITECVTIPLDGCDVQESISFVYHQQGVGRPYRRSIGIDDDSRWFLCMNPLQSSLLSESEFLEMDVTFENCRDYPYLLNVTRFSFIVMKCKFWLYNIIPIVHFCS